MTRLYFEEMMESMGCIVQDYFAFGVIESWPYSVELLDTGGIAEIQVRFLAGGSTVKTAKALKQKGAAHQRWTGENEETSTLFCVYTPPSDFYVKAGLREILKSGADALLWQKLSPPKECPLCEKSGCDSYAYLNEDYTPCHAYCVDNSLDLPEADHYLQKQTQGKVLSGVLGAFMGAFIGALPIWVLALNQNTIYFALYVFIPILSGLLYRLLRGKANKNIGGISVLVSSLVMAVGLELVWNWILLSYQTGKNLPFFETAEYYFASHNIILSVQEMLFNLVALMVGFLATLRFLRRYEDESNEVGGIIRGATFIKKSTVPIVNFKEEAEKRKHVYEEQNDDVYT